MELRDPPGASSSAGNIPPEGIEIPLRASFTGLSFLPGIALGHNSLNPLLHLHPDGIEYRVIRRRRRHWSDVARVDAFTAFGTRDLTFRWTDTVFAFTANIGDDRSRILVLRIVEYRGLTLSESARRLLADSAATDT